MSYWKNLITDFPSQDKLGVEGIDIPAIDSQETNTYASTKIHLPAKLITALKKFATHHKLSFSAVLHGAWGILLNRCSNTDDLIYGTAVTTKTKSKSKSLILPIRSTLQDTDTVLAYLKKIATTLKENSKQAKSYHCEAEKLIYYLILAEKQKPNLDLDHHPLVLHIEKLTPPVKINLLYNPARFNSENIASLAEHWIVILEKILTDHEQTVQHVSILTAKEKQLLHAWGRPESHLILKKSERAQDMFILQAKKTPQHLAVACEDITLTYQQLDEVSTQIANLLLQKKVRTGDTIAVMMERTPALIAVMMAIFKVGAVFVPINPKYPDERIEFILSDCNTHLILANQTHSIPAEHLYKSILIDDHYAAVKSLPTHLPSTFKLPEEELVAYVIYTSGTTGQPKGVMVKHIGLVNLIHWYNTCFHVTPSDRSMQFASQGFDPFFCETIPFLALGASVHIISDNTKLTPSLLLPWLIQHKISICDLPTAYAQVLFNLSWPDNMNLRTVKVGGENFAHYPNKRFPFDIWNGYGPTEATVETTYIKLIQAHVDPENQPYKRVPPPIGKPITHSEMYVVDRHMELVPIGCVGELLIGGIGLSPGYLNRQQLTRDKFIRHLFSNDSDAKLYRTGDLVRWLNDGNLEFVGRVDHQIKISGYRIEISEIETALKQYPDVGEVVVLAKELVNGQKTLIAYLVPNLDRIRIPYQERGLIAVDDIHYSQIFVEDISKEGLAISGISEKISINQPIRLNIKLPGSNESTWLTGTVIWQQDQRAGIKFDPTPAQKALLEKCIEYYLSTHNLMETLQSAAAKRSLRKALKKRLPEYMIPGVFSILPHFPLTFNGKIDWKALPPPQDFERLLERNYVAPRNETEEKLATIWCEVLNQPRVSITDNFFDLGGNSLLVSQLSVRILQEFNHSIPAKIFFDLPFIPIIAEYIDSNGTKYTYKSSIQEEIRRDSILNDDILPQKSLSKHLKKPKGILLTGAAGFLGIYLLRELIKQTDAKIYCLIRKGGFENVAKRLINNIQQYELGDEVTLSNRRIIIIASDIGLDQFGIPAELYNNLAENVDMIFHCGAQVNTMAAYSNLRTSNVQGTIEVIKFALHKVDKPIHYISTLSSAYKKDAAGNYSEEFPDTDSSQLIGGYAISKWVSERLLTQIKNRGLPVCIYRSGYILGQSDTGITNMNDALLLLIKGCIQLGFAPNWKEKITILPVDFVSRAIVEIALHEQNHSGVFHLDHPTGMMWLDLIAWLNNYGYAIKICSHQEWLQHLLSINRENALYPFLPHYLSQPTEPATPDTSMQHTLKLLKELNLPYPELNDNLLLTYFNYLTRAGFFPDPSGRKRSVESTS